MQSIDLIFEIAIKYDESKIFWVISVQIKNHQYEANIVIHNIRWREVFSIIDRKKYKLLSILFLLKICIHNFL